MINFVKSLLGLRTVSSPTCDNDRTLKWKTDVVFIEKELPRRHKNLFHKLDRNEFFEEISQLKKNIDQLSDNQLMICLMKIIAKIKDGHTKLVINNKEKYPFEFYCFEDGVHLIKATEDYCSHIGNKLTHINDHPIDSIMNDLKSITSSDNTQQLKYRTVQYLCVPEVLNGLEIIDDYKTKFKFQNQEGIYYDVLVEPISKEESKIIHNSLTPISQMLHLSNLDKKYWYKYDEAEEVLYFQYNSCTNSKELSFKTFNTKMFEVIDKNKIQKLIVDIRYNGGGNSLVINPFFNEIKKRPHLNNNNTLFVIIGRETFSSALLNVVKFKNKTNALLVGEPTGGKPNHFGEVMYLNLINTNLKVMYSTQYFKNIEEDFDYIEPDILTNITSVDYLSNLDKPYLEIINSK